MDKKNAVVIAAVAALALLLLGFAVLRPQVKTAEENMAIITVDGKEYTRVPLSRPQTVTVRQKDGSVNVIEVTERGAVMQSSTCGNQLCVKMGEVTLDNWQFRPNQQFIICLPNRVSVELAVTE
ncbi:MAG: NusG domain II-containing protein [Clostridiales bacterium]|nr:NusG domain II-containing protein [Clostridiales bacterium]